MVGYFASAPSAASALKAPVPVQGAAEHPLQIEVMRVKPVDPATPNLRLQLSDGSVDLMQRLSLGSLEGVGGTCKMPPTAETACDLAEPLKLRGGPMRPRRQPQ
jgi:hypothetical protein